MPDAKFLGLDSTAWTALSAIIALLIAVGGLFVPWLRTKVQRSKLSIDVEEHRFSSLSGEAYWFRIPVGNRAADTVAKNVEIHLETAERVGEGKRLSRDEHSISAGGHSGSHPRIDD